MTTKRISIAHSTASNSNARRFSYRKLNFVETLLDHTQRDRSRLLAKMEDKKHTNRLGQVKAAPQNFEIKSRRRRHFQSFFSNFDKCRPEVDGDVISAVTIDYRSAWILRQTVLEIFKPLTL